MESWEDLSHGQELSMKGNDSNTIMLPGKKKKKKRMSKVSGKPKTEKNTAPSNSQKKKLKKLQAEKEKEHLLSKSVETLEKYKIGEDAYSLLWSSRTLGQAETVREKRRRGVQFSKAGIYFPKNDRPIKRKTGDSTCDLEFDSSRALLRPRCNAVDASCPVIGETDVQRSISTYGSNVSGCEASSSVLGTCGNSDLSILEDPQLSLPMSSSNGTDMEKSSCRRNEYSERNLSSASSLPDSPPLSVLVAPIVVHVSRPKELESKRKDLPIVMMEQEIMEAINDNVSVIICGETGCGKTTQVPQFLYEAGFGSSHGLLHSGMIGVTQPRRVAVLATAKRVAFELGLSLGKEVGFQVRYDKRIGDNCSIKVMTDGILLRELQNDFLLKKYSIILLDEAHERSLNTDILIGMLSRVIQLRQIFYKEQVAYETLSGKKLSPENRIFPLKLVLMSATLRVEDFLSGRKIFSEPPPVIEVPTRQYPVTVHFSKRTEIHDYIGQAYKKVLSIHKKLPPGGILVFVTGQREVEFLCQKLCKASKEMVANSSRQIVDVHAMSEGNSIDDHAIKEIDEAYEIEGNASLLQTDRFSSCDGDLGDFAKDELDFCSYSDEDSDVEGFDEDMDLFDQNNLDSDDNLVDVSRGGNNLASLKAAFETLAGENTSKLNAEAKVVAPVTSGGSERSTPNMRVKMGKADDPLVSEMCVLPLYAMLPASAQLRVFDEVKDGERLVVIATNVAETSLTIPGIKYVVDTGREKVKIYNSPSGMEAYEVQWISKASAAQRAGRAGRTGPGHCYRLYSSAVFNNIFPDFSTAEISKVPVDGVVLLMKSMGIDKVENFPFPTPPKSTAIVDAQHCLKVLEAIDSDGRLTSLGKAMAHYPLSPRHSRMLLTVLQILKNSKGYSRPNLVLSYAVAAAAALSLSIPFVTHIEANHASSNELKHVETSGVTECNKTLDKEEKLRIKTAKASRAKFMNPTSDALSIANVLQCFELSENPAKFCKDNALHQKTMEEMSKLRKQLLKLVFHQSSCNSDHDFSWPHGTIENVECAWRNLSDKQHLLLLEEELLGQAICAGWADRVAKRIKGHSYLSDGERKVSAVRYQACMVKETVFLHRRSSISKFAPEYLVYSELLNTKRAYIHGASSVKPDWLVKYAGSLCSFSSPHTDPRPFYEPLSDQVFCWVTPTFGPHLWQLPLHSFPMKDDKERVAVFAYSLLGGIVLPCLKPVQKFLAAAPAIILRPESSGLKRVGNLLFKLNTKLRTIDSCVMLKKMWDENPDDLYPEIRDWFQEVYHNQFEELWVQMHREIRLDPEQRFAKKGRNRK